MNFRPNPFHANYILNVYNMSYMYLNKILFKPADSVVMLVTAMYTASKQASLFERITGKAFFITNLCHFS